jgi:hypothetical protein
MLAHVHGGTLNASELGRVLSLDQKTASRYVDILAGLDEGIVAVPLAHVREEADRL